MGEATSSRDSGVKKNKGRFTLSEADIPKGGDPTVNANDPVFRQSNGSGQLFSQLTSTPAARSGGQQEPAANQVFGSPSAPSTQKATTQTKQTTRGSTVLGAQGGQTSGRRRQRSATVLNLGLASTTKKKLLGQ